MGSKRIGLARTQKLLENLRGNINWKSSKLNGLKKEVVKASDGPAGVPTITVLTADQSGATCLFDQVAASQFTLPAPVAGLEFTFITTITATADHVITVNNANVDGFLGGVVSVSTTAAKSDSFGADADGSNDFITLDGGTTGGAVGTRIHVVAIDSENWAVDGQVCCVGSSTATPFGDAQL
jgi:hypothetical protein